MEHIEVTVVFTEPDGLAHTGMSYDREDESPIEFLERSFGATIDLFVLDIGSPNLVDIQSITLELK